MGETNCIVRCVPCMRKPMVLLEKDGGKPVPGPGVLFYIIPGYQPTIFPGPEKASKAIAASISWRKRGVADEYEIQSVEDWELEQEMDKMPLSKRRKLEKSDVKNPVIPEATGASPGPNA